MIENLIYQLPDSIALLDRNFRYVAHSKKWLEAFELGNESLVGKLHYDIFPEIGQSWKELHIRCLNGEFFEREIEKFERKSGKNQWIKGSLSPWRNDSGEIVGIIIRSENVTANQILKQTLEDDRKLFSEGPVMVFKWKYEEKWILDYYSPNVINQFGYKEEEFVNTPFLSFIHPEDIERVREEFSYYKVQKAETFSQEYRIRNSKGEYHWVFDFTYFKWNQDGELLLISTYIINIDVQKQYESELLEKNREIQGIFNAIPDIYFKLKKDSTIISCFTSNLDDLNFQGKDLNQKRLDEIMPISVAKQIQKALDQAFNTQKIELVNYSLPFANENRFFEARISPISENEAIAVVTNITEKVMRNQLIVESENRYRTIIEQTGHLIYEFDIATGEILWDGAIEKITGYTKEEFLKVNIKEWEDLLYPADRENVRQKLYRSIRESNVYNDEYQFKTKSGEYIFVQDNGVIIYDSNNNPQRILGTIKDISYIKKSEQNLVLEKARLAGIIEATNIGASEWNIQTGERVYNEKWANIIGYTLQELMPLDDNTWKKLSHPEDYIRSRELLAKLFNKEVDFYDIECRVKHKDGHWIWVHDKGKVVKWTEDGKPLLMLGALNDISERKKIELERKATLSLLSEQNKRLLNFAHIVSHNLRSHTSNFQGLLELYQLEEQQTEKERYINLLKATSEKLNETIYNLNEVVNINANINEKKANVHLAKMLDDIQKNIIVMINSNNAKINYNFDLSIKIKTIPAYLESILLNLITNSIKYRSPERTPEISIEVKVRDKLTVLTLIDNGIGIDLSKYGAKLFGMYQTFHGNKDARGIGLFIIKNQIESMGGKIKVKSEVGKGTTWKVYFYE